MRSQSAAAVNKSEMRLSISKIQDAKTGDEDDIEEDGENGEEEQGLEIRKALLKQSRHASLNFPLYDLSFCRHFKLLIKR